MNTSFGYYIDKIKDLIIDPVYRMRYLSRMGFYKNDEEYIKKLYYRIFGKKLNLKNPRTFNEKNNWRKLYDRRAIYTQMVDKYRSKEFVRKRVGEGYTFPLLGVWNKPEQIKFDSLPEKFVLKSNHGGGYCSL